MSELEPASSARRERSRLPVPAGWLVGGLAALALLTASRVYLSLAIKGVGDPFPEIVLGETLKWALWLPVIPLVVSIDRRWGFGRSPLPAALALHIPLAVLVLAAHTLIMTVAGQAGGWYFAQETARDTALIRLIHEGGTVLLVYAAVIGLDHFRRHRMEREQSRLSASRLEAQLATERLRNLQGQLHPHFLFNALHAVAGLLREGERDRAVDTVSKLGELLRISLRRADRQLVRLSEELDFLEAYLDIQKARHGSHLRIDWRVETETLDLLVPHLLLQPLVENAVEHGVGHVIGAGPGEESAGRIEIEARRAGSRLVLEVLDNGPGPDAFPATIPPGEDAGDRGLGLRNTAARLRTLYDEDFTLEIEPREGGGTRARVAIPARHAQADG